MRICQVSSPLSLSDTTALDRYVANLSRELVRLGHEVENFELYPADGPHLSMRREERDGYAVTRVVDNVSSRQPGVLPRVPRLAEAFSHFLEHERPEIVHFQHLLSSDLSPIQTAAKHNIAALWTAHENPFRYSLPRHGLRRLALIVATSRDQLRQLEAAGIDPACLELIPEIPTVERFGPHTAQLVELYRQQVEDLSQSELDALPLSLRATVARYREVESLPTRDLLRRVLTGLTRLRRGLAEAMEAPELDDLLLDALSTETEHRGRFHDMRNELIWRRQAAKKMVQEHRTREGERECLRRKLDAATALGLAASELCEITLRRRESSVGD